MLNVLDMTDKWFKIAVSVTILLVSIWSVSSYVISNQTGPITTRIAAAELKIKDHIEISNNCLKKIPSKIEFDLKILAINKDIKLIQLSQNQLVLKFDNLINVLLEKEKIRDYRK